MRAARHDKKRAILAAALMLGGQAASSDAPAQLAPPPAEVGSARATLSNKLRLVRTVLAQSPAVQRIPSSGNQEAQTRLADARTLYQKAVTDAEAGRVPEAMRGLDEALRLIASASSLVPDPARLEAFERIRYSELRDAIRTFLNLHRTLSSRPNVKRVPGPDLALDVKRIDMLVEKAEGQAAAGSFAGANELLGNAYRIVVSALNKMMASETIVYDLKFETPAEEYQYEAARNSSYEGLVPIALQQLNVPPQTAGLVETYVRQSRQLRGNAERQAGAGDHRAAIRSIQDATGFLQRALQLSGVVVPQAAQSPDTGPRP